MADHDVEPSEPAVIAEDEVIRALTARCDAGDVQPWLLRGTNTMRGDEGTPGTDPEVVTAREREGVACAVAAKEDVKAHGGVEQLGRLSNSQGIWPSLPFLLSLVCVWLTMEFEGPGPGGPEAAGTSKQSRARFLMPLRGGSCFLGAARNKNKTKGPWGPTSSGHCGIHMPDTRPHTNPNPQAAFARAPVGRVAIAGAVDYPKGTTTAPKRRRLALATTAVPCPDHGR